MNLSGMVDGWSIFPWLILQSTLIKDEVGDGLRGYCGGLIIY